MKYVNLEVDLTRSGLEVASSDDFVSIWSRLEERLASRTLPSDDLPLMEPIGDSGEYVRLRVLSSGFSGKSLAPNTRLSVSNLIEPIKPDSTCRLCEARGQLVQADYLCSKCGGQEKYCNEHVHDIEGSLRANGLYRCLCVNHQFSCESCKEAGSFFCSGPLCKSEKVHCHTHGRYVPSNPSNAYCLACADLVHPKCDVKNCEEPGFASCEHYDSKLGSACGKKYCMQHSARWQIFGPSEIGLAYCKEHRARLRTCSPEEITYLTVAGVALRRRTSFAEVTADDMKFRLPTLPGLKFILQKSRNKYFDEKMARDQYRELMQTLGQGLGRQGIVERDMLDQLNKWKGSWEKQVTQANTRKSAGEDYFQKLLGVINQTFRVNAADVVSFSDFYPARIHKDSGNEVPPVLIVTVREDFKAMFIGRKGSMVKQLGELIGCSVRLEKEL